MSKSSKLSSLVAAAAVMAATAGSWAGPAAAQSCPDPAGNPSLSDFPEATPCEFGVFSGRTNNDLHAVNGDGTVVVGQSKGPDGIRAFRWEAGGGMQDLGTLPGGTISFAHDVSGDGSVVVGGSGSTDGQRAFRWEAGGGMQDLGTLPGGTSSFATDVSGDGSVVVGGSGSTDGQRAFRWEAGGGMQDLGTLPGGTISFATDVNDDGSVVVGGSGSTDGQRAVYWVDDASPHNLGTLPGGTSSLATGVSGDGSVIVGWSTGTDGSSRPFIWKTRMQDLVNLRMSLPLLANDSEVARAQQQQSVGLVTDQACLAAGGGNCIRTTLSAGHTGSGDGIGARSGLQGLLSWGYGIGERTTLGASLGVNGNSLRNNAFNMSPGPAAALWAVYSEGGLERVGWQADGAIGWGRASGEIARGRKLTAVMVSSGDAALETGVVRARLGYGFEPHSGWLLTPSLGIAHYRTRRGAYTESGADFTASYDRLTTKRTALTLALSAETALGEHGSLSLSAGVGRDLLRRDDVVLAGTYDLPGTGAFSLASSLDRNTTRPFASARYDHDLENGATVSGTLGVARPEFGSTPQARASVSYAVRF